MKEPITCPDCKTRKTSLGVRCELCSHLLCRECYDAGDGLCTICKPDPDEYDVE